MPWFWRTSKEDEEDFSSEYDSEDYSSELDSQDGTQNEVPSLAKEDLRTNPEQSEMIPVAEEKKNLDCSISHQKEEGKIEKDGNGFVADGENECVPVEFVKTAKAARARLDSGLTFGDEEDHDKNDFRLPDTDSDDSEPSLQNKETRERSNDPPIYTNIEDNDSEEEDAVTSTTEKLSLLLLAAEHDRVDILNSIVAEEKDGPRTLLDGNDNSTIPPLHIAVSYGSVNATNCLLRMGADPSIRPNAALIQEKTKHMEKSLSASQLQRYDDASAWELVFGRDTSNQSLNTLTRKTQRKTKIEALDIPPSKREGIRHAFTAEALRCIGSDEVDRLQQLLESGMPHQIDIGGKHLYDWAVEMGALRCEELLRSTQVDSSSNADSSEPKKTVVLGRGEPQSISSLLNRLDESNALSNALSSCLDNLGEEVAVCSGLLLLGSGASALASHVRSLRSTLQSKQDELDRLQEAWANSEDELEYWVKNCGSEGEKIASQMFVHKQESQELSGDDDHQRQQVIAQIAASENKIRMLRVSIADLSEENARNLLEVEKRGLSGGITLVRGLREQIKDLDYKISLAKSGDAECCMKISLLQSKARAIAEISEEIGGGNRDDGGSQDGERVETDEVVNSRPNETDQGISQENKPVPAASEQTCTSQSTAIVLRPPGDRGFFPLSLWTILMRIIGLSDTPLRRQNSRATPAVII